MKNNTTGKALSVTADLSAIESMLAARGITGVSPEVAAARYIRYIASEESVDTVGDVILASAWDVKEWLENPAMFADHKNSVESMVARGLNAAVIGKQLVVDAFFLPAELDASGLAEACFKMARAGILTDCSVGYVRKSGGWRWASDADKTLFGKECSGIYSAVTLKELSCVGVGAHHRAKVEAVAKALHAGALSDNDVRALQGNESTEDLIERALFRMSGAKGFSAPEPQVTNVVNHAPVDLSPLTAQMEAMGKQIAALSRKTLATQVQKELGLGIFLPLESAMAIATYAEAIEDEIGKYIPKDEDEEDETSAPAPVNPPYQEEPKPSEFSEVEEAIKQFTTTAKRLTNG